MIQAGNITKSKTRRALITVLGFAALGASLGATMGGCRGDRSDAPPRRFFPDMDHQPKLKAQSQSKFFENGRTERLPVDGTVAFGASALAPKGGQGWVEMADKDRADKLRDDDTYYFGLVKGTTDQYVDRMPIEVTRELILRGQERFNIYCSMCHGYDAMGGESGTVGRLMNVRPVNLLDAKYRDRAGDFGTDGYIFHIIRQGLWSPDGKNRMPAYGHAIKEQDAWGIVAYLRTLQKAFDANGKQVGQAQDTPIEQPIATTKNGGEG